MKATNKLNKYLYPENLILELKKFKSNKRQKISNVPKFIFLCGKGISNEEQEKYSNRSYVIDFFKRRNRKDLYFLYAEKLWDVNFGKKIDLLTYEEFLASLSDGIILFVESFGSACELGAFSIRNDLIHKMLVVIDNKHKEEKSFIQEGPVKKIIKINSDNVTYTDLSAIFSSPEIYSKLDKFVTNKTCKINYDKDNIDLRSFILEVFELIYMLGPISLFDLILIYKSIKEFEEFDPKIRVKEVIDLLQKFELIEMKNGSLLPKQHQFNQPFMFDMSRNHFNSLRAKFLARKYKYGEGILA